MECSSNLKIYFFKNIAWRLLHPEKVAVESYNIPFLFYTKNNLLTHWYKIFSANHRFHIDIYVKYIDLGYNIRKKMIFVSKVKEHIMWPDNKFSNNSNICIDVTITMSYCLYNWFDIGWVFDYINSIFRSDIPIQNVTDHLLMFQYEYVAIIILTSALWNA